MGSDKGMQGSGETEDGQVETEPEWMGNCMEGWRAEWWDGGMVGWIHLLVVRAFSSGSDTPFPVDACSPAQGPGSSSEGHNAPDHPALDRVRRGKRPTLKKTLTLGKATERQDFQN